MKEIRLKENVNTIAFRNKKVLACNSLSKIVLFLFFVITARPVSSQAHEIIFCGERIPIENEVVAKQLMNIIRRQIPNVNLAQLRKRVEQNFPIVEYYLKATGLPEDFKYLAIVESGFQNLTSPVGARGFWQIMPKTALQYGLRIDAPNDDRDDIYKSTYAACKLLADNYLDLKKKYKVSSWVLTAAAYNYGIGNMFKVINKQGKDYFSMQLNPETAVYVYKIIAVKELFEYPELYMKDFGYNVFSLAANKKNIKLSAADTTAFTSMELQVNENDGKHPDQIVVKQLTSADLSNAPKESKDLKNTRYIAAGIHGRHKNFQDGDLIAVRFLENSEIRGNYYRRGAVIKGKGWIIGDRIFIDLGYGDRNVSLMDIRGTKGIPVSELKDETTILIRITNT